MNGVEILSSIYEYESLMSPFWALGFGIAALIIVIIGLLTLTFDNIQDKLLILEVVLIAAMIICIIGAYIKTDEIIDTTYKVTIDDSVSMNEFLDKYEILDQEGKIYTVKERE